MYSSYPWCTNGREGSAGDLQPGIPCIFPFTFRGVVYDGLTCVKDDRVGGSWGWCPITENYARDQAWGSCQYCHDVLTGDDLEEVKSRIGKPKHRGFDVVRWLVQTLFFLVMFAALFATVGFLWRKQNFNRYQLVSNKSQ